MFADNDTRRQALKEERHNEMQQFMAQQAQQNPRLRKLRSYQPEIIVSIADPSIGNLSSLMECLPVFPPPNRSSGQINGNTLYHEQNTSSTANRNISRSQHSFPHERHVSSPPRSHSSIKNIDQLNGGYPYFHQKYDYFKSDDRHHSPQTRTVPQNAMSHTQNHLKSPASSWNIGQTESGSTSKLHQKQQYAQDLKRQMMEDRERRDFERRGNVAMGENNRYQPQQNSHYSQNQGQFEYGGMVGKKQQQISEAPYFGKNETKVNKNYSQAATEDVYHFSRRMAGQINFSHDKNQYLHELNEQVRLKKEREANEKANIRAEEIKEMNQFNPWGKAGGGAPLRNSDGSISTNLRNSRPDQNGNLLAQNLFSHGTFGNIGVGIAPQHSTISQSYLPQNRHEQQYGMNFLPNAAGQTELYPYNSVGIIQPPYPLATHYDAALSGLNIQMTNPPQPQHSNSVPLQGPKTFLRGQVAFDQMPDWQRAELAEKQKAQQKIQEELRQQVQEREALKAKEEAKKREEEEREQQRLMKEQETLRLKYAKELEDQRKKEAEIQAENERKLAEKISKTKEAERLREKIIQESEKTKNQNSISGVGNNKGVTSLTEASYQPFRSNSPPIPTMRNKSEQQTKNAPTEYPTIPKDSIPAPLQKITEKSNDIIYTQGPIVDSRKSCFQIDSKVETFAVLDQLLKIKQELEDEDQKIKIDLAAPISIANKRKKTAKARNFLDELIANSHQSTVNSTMENLHKSKFYIPSILEQQKEILDQQHREIKALKDEGKRNQIWMNESIKRSHSGIPNSNVHEEPLQSHDNAKIYKYL
ncbi:hypothetical protein HK100_002638, partial [Physocladia obscura]